MALNIKDEETHRLVSQLAKLTGESLTLAVKISVMERLARKEQAPEQGSRIEALMRFSEYCAPFFKDGPSGNELINELYDEEAGLPK
jgi:antitoxin VapB